MPPTAATATRPMAREGGATLRRGPVSTASGAASARLPARRGALLGRYG